MLPPGRTDLEAGDPLLAQQEVSAFLRFKMPSWLPKGLEVPRRELAHLDWQMAGGTAQARGGRTAIGAETTHGPLEAEIAVRESQTSFWQEV